MSMRPSLLAVFGHSGGPSASNRAGRGLCYLLRARALARTGARRNKAVAVNGVEGVEARPADVAHVARAVVVGRHVSKGAQARGRLQAVALKGIGAHAAEALLVALASAGLAAAVQVRRQARGWQRRCSCGWGRSNVAR